MLRMCLKLMLNVAFGRIKLQDFDACERALFYFTQIDVVLEGLCEDLGEPVDHEDDIGAYFYILQIWVFLHGKRTTGPRPVMKTVKETVKRLECLAVVFNGSHQQHMQHDSEVLKRFHDQDAVLCKDSWPLEQCSATLLPLPFISYHKLTGGLTERDHFEGWQDIGFLHSLDQSDKANINQVQRMRGLAITDFDQIALSHEAHRRKKTET
jgi:hypothetical protein